MTPPPRTWCTLLCGILLGCQPALDAPAPSPSAGEPSIEVDLDQVEGSVGNLLGMSIPQDMLSEGEIAPAISQKSSTLDLGWYRAGADSGNPLATIFVDCSGEADDPSSYDFTAIDRIFDAAIAAGARPIYFLGFDINCRGEGGGALDGTGARPDDYDKWVVVAINVMKHFNGLFDVPKQGRQYSRGDVGHFVVWDEPSDAATLPDLGTGAPFHGYWDGSFDEFWRLYKQLAEAVDADPDLRELVKIGHPAGFYNGNRTFEGDDSFLGALTAEHTRLDFIVVDTYKTDLWGFLHGGTDLALAEARALKHTLETEHGYAGVELLITAFGFRCASLGALSGDAEQVRSALGYCARGSSGCPTGNEYNLESPYGASLLTAMLIAAAREGFTAFVWENPFVRAPLAVMATGALFDETGALTYEGLAYRMFSRLRADDRVLEGKVAGSSFEFSEELREQQKGELAGYQQQNALQVLATTDEVRRSAGVLISSWSLDPAAQPGGSLTLSINGLPDGDYTLRVIAVDARHTFPDRCGRCPWWDDALLSAVPEDVQGEMNQARELCGELEPIYCPDRGDDASLRYEDDLGIAREESVTCRGGVVELLLDKPQGAAVYLVELDAV